MSSNLYQEIREFYDASSSLWESLWGEHMHHGYYGKYGNYRLERRQAQIALIEELLYWTGYNSHQERVPQNIIDVGCGIGGSTLYLAEKFDCRATGITLSPVQADRAQARAKELGLDQQVQFTVANALEMPFEDGTFDLVWSLESGEHMPNKTHFLAECYRILKPGGKIILATWCHRETASLAGDLTPSEIAHLKEIYRVYCLPYVISLSEYRAIARQQGFKTLKVDDWSTAVEPFWHEVIGSAISPQAVWGLLCSGWPTIQGALSLNLMSSGYERGLVRFGVLTGSK